MFLYILLYAMLFVALPSMHCVEKNHDKVFVSLDKAHDARSVTKEKMSLLLGVLPHSDECIKKTLPYLQACLERTGQFAVSVQYFQKPRLKREIQALFEKGFDWVIFVSQTDDKKGYEWRLYDPTDAEMVKGQRVYPRSKLTREAGYAIADHLWPCLCNDQGSFMSKIAYIKRGKDHHKKPTSSIYVCDYDGSHKQVLQSQKGIYVGTYWHRSSYNPSLLCSEFTKFNVRLVSFNMDAYKRVVLSVDGTCVGISLSEHSQEALYCRSGDIWHYGYNSKLKKSVHTRLIKHAGKNSDPILLPSGDIIYCSDDPLLHTQGARSKGAKICYYDNIKKSTRVLTPDGYCVSPCYNTLKKRLIYSRKSNGYMQLYMYDLQSDKHTQLTHGKGNKTDSCLSPCGQYVVFCYDDGLSSRIAVYYIPTKKMWFITPKNEECVYPSWSNKLHFLISVV
jgi:Tol biopolymer transport system component